MPSFVWFLLLVPLWMVLSRIFSARDSGTSAARRPEDAQRDAHEQCLVAAVMGDRLQAERLIVHEFRRNPGLSREEAAKAAFGRLACDRDASDALDDGSVVVDEGVVTLQDLGG